MSYKSDPQIFTDAYHLYLEGLYQNAYDLLTEVGPNFPEEGLRVAEWRMDIAARLGQLELAEKILADAQDAGYFYGEYALRKDEDMQAMQGRPVFEALARRNFELLAEAQRKAAPWLEIINNGMADNQGKPLLIALHGNSSNVSRFKDNWISLLGSNWLVALPQSSQVNGKDIFSWNDISIVESEIKNHYKNLNRDHQIDQTKTILSGFSKGGHVAIEGALRSYFPIKGFLAIAPYIGDRDAMLTLLDSNRFHHLRGYFLIGEKDEECASGGIWLFEELRKRGFVCEIQITPGLGHEFPDSFGKILPDLLQFLLEE